ncbi:hypothetical protein [Salinivibrio proteolyticus]|uniref:DNA gyrase subunit B n=1 Tax=Salinivibrio proteolyticus TaxID=334715 RepID=A0ABY7L9D7_9GAMM|nr:hypothetical protein [Salinivibrio proteolyticus]WBA13865.1 hypothetical protein N7E60_08995 [Salinivibrio proteolyticus]
MTLQKPFSVYKTIKKVPVIGSVFAIANCYAHKGSYFSEVSVAGFSMWWKRILKKMLYVFLFTLLLIYWSPGSSNWSPADTILSAFPSILGFGIGAYALLFIMPREFLQFLWKMKNEKGSSIGPEMVPADMAYPLTTYAVVIIIAAVAKIFEDSYSLYVFSMWSLFYGLAMTIELISFLFNSSKMINRIRLDASEDGKEDD